MGLLANRVALVTGATEGIGRGIALAMLDEGARVVVTGRSSEKGDKLVAEVGDADRIAFARADATDPDQTAAAVDAAVARFGRVDVLVNNAGGSAGEFALVHELRDEVWQRGITLNLHSAFWATRRVLPDMLSRGWGRIINLSSVEGKLATMSAISPYVAAKHAIAGLTKAVAVEYGPQGITCNAICPGLVEPERRRHDSGEAASAAAGIDYAEFVAKFVRETKTKRLTTVAEVAAMANLLASEAGGGITGQMISVDGGTAPW